MIDKNITDHWIQFYKNNSNVLKKKKKKYTMKKYYSRINRLGNELTKNSINILTHVCVNYFLSFAEIRM